jgi:AmmeMemoRadiSam system protein A
MIGGIGQAEGRILLSWARDNILEGLGMKALGEAPVRGGALEAKAGAFVSLHKDGRLRGCIGRMSSDKALIETVAEMAKAAAFEDPRFPPLTAGEAGATRLELTILSPMKKIADVAEIEVGRHGLYLVKGWHSGVFLPQVPLEQGWNRTDYLENLGYKAGLGPDAWRAPDTELFIFEGLIFSEA